MAKKSGSANTGRTDPKKNKSLAIRNVLKKMPGAKATEVAAAVKKQYGHAVNENRVYMVKTKANMASDGRPPRSKTKEKTTPMTSAALWIEAIKVARQLLNATGSVPNAVALLKAVEG